MYQICILIIINLTIKKITEALSETRSDGGLGTNREAFQTWSFTLEEEHTLKLFENRVLRRIFRPKRKEVVGGCRRQHNEELHKLNALPYIFRVMKSRG
jgi:hypothetical protein